MFYGNQNYILLHQHFELEFSIDQLCMCNPLLTSTQRFWEEAVLLWSSGILCMYIVMCKTTPKRTIYITYYLANPHRYNYEEHSYMLPR